MDTGCRACKGLNEAEVHIQLHGDPNDFDGCTLDLCYSCLLDAPTWAGWDCWTDYEKAQRERLLAEEEKEKVPA